MFARLAVVLLVTTGMGCGSAKSSGPALVPAEGVLTLKDKPLAGATVFFYPEDGAGASCAGNTDESGKFTLWTNAKAGASPGKYRVTVKCYTKKDGSPLTLTEADRANGMDEEQLITAGQAKLGVPPKYLSRETTPLNVEVVASSTAPIVVSIN